MPSPREHAADANPEAVCLDGWDDCIVGITSDGCLVYDRAKMVRLMSRRDGVSFEEADEWISFNAERTLPYIDNFRPVIFNPFPPDR